MRYTILTWLTMITVILMASCTNTQSSNTGKQHSASLSFPEQKNVPVNILADAQTIRQALLSYEFSEELALISVLKRSDSDEVRRFVGIHAAGATTVVEADETRLGVLENKQVGWWTTRSTLGLISMAYLSSGIMPTSAVDFYPELATKRGVDRFYKLSPQERLSRYIGGINPITKRFYGSFDSFKPEPGGIAIEPLVKRPDGLYSSSEGVTGFVEVSVGAADTENRPAFDGAFMYKVYSADGKSVLYSDYCTFERGKSDGTPPAISTKLHDERAHVNL